MFQPLPHAQSCHLHILCRIDIALHWQTVLIGQVCKGAGMGGGEGAPLMLHINFDDD